MATRGIFTSSLIHLLHCFPEGIGRMRDIVTLQCSECKERNYTTTKNKKTTTGRLEFKKFCNRCRKHQPHKETK
jgi:large subunit ribosomal protein L33